MLRLILTLLLLAAPAGAAPPQTDLLHPSPAFQPRGAEQARGALVWLTDASASPEPAWLRRAAERGYDIWMFEPTGPDPLAAGLAALRADGYPRLIVAGQSRAAWIALTVLSHPGLADGVAAFSPSEYDSISEQHPEAIGAFEALMRAAGHAPNTRLVFAQFADDPFDPDPQRRQDAVRQAGRTQALKLLPIFLPDRPRGHEGVYRPEFDRLFGARIVRFLDPEARRLESARPAPR